MNHLQIRAHELSWTHTKSRGNNPEMTKLPILSEVLNGMILVTAWPGLHESPTFFCEDLAERHRSIRRLAER
jgi:hypothetical protein